MRHFKHLIPAMICLALSCKSPSEKVMDNFREVNESLEKTNKTVDSLNQQLQFVGFDKAVADSLELLFNHASIYIKRLKAQLDSADSNGENLNVAAGMLIQTPKGDSLFNYVMSVYDVGIKYGDSTIANQFRLTRENNKNKWLEKYFKMVPTIAASTILSKFQNDCSYIRMAVAGAGMKELKKKILSE